MRETVFVSNLCLHAFHGVFPEEKRLGQKFFIDINCRLAVPPGGVGDDYGQTVCYDSLCNLAQEISEAQSFDLIETLGERISQSILDRFATVREVSVTIRKPSAPIRASLDHVGITVSRQRRAKVAFSLGSNIGDKEAHLSLALAHLHATDGVEIHQTSKFYRTAPWGKVDQDWFVNCCATGVSTLEPMELMKLCKRIELTVGRVPAERWGPRVIDIDLLHMDDICVETEVLCLPHRELFNRAFVLEPLAEIAPDLEICGRRVAVEADRVMKLTAGE
ncbi:MAG: 2-amino-4-hydroxy-6-hydroxymethyldihydropteridine diphosphokinase [Mangrovicoccus sp.]